MLVGFVIFVLFNLLVLPTQTSTTDPDHVTPDLSFYYSAGDLYAMAEGYGEQGRSEYVRARFTFDLIWPLVYTLFLTTSISWFAARAYPVTDPWRRLNILPLLGMAFDYLENISTSLVMIRFPENLAFVGSLAGIFTTFKWIFIAASFVFLVVSLILYIVHRYRSRKP